MSNSIQLLAHDLASRIPAMAQDSAINNAHMIEKEIEAVVAERDALLREVMEAMLTPTSSSIKLGFAVWVSKRQLGALRKICAHLNEPDPTL